ncbi:MAG TPA: glycosyltransferase [Candidatus Limnocylindrales bacterium]|nr:glycosyltransferase [Candidatus Limnocylindrales bacterium]
MESRISSQERPRILIISSAIIDQQMSGPAIRCFEFANVLSKSFQVSLVTPSAGNLSSERFQILTCERHEEDKMQKIVEHHDVILIQGQVLEFFPFLKETEKVLVVDLYCPFILEELEKQRRLWSNAATGSLQALEEQQRIHETISRIVRDQLLAGDYFLCAHERQRDFWLGMLCGLNRVNPYTYHQDPSARRLLDLVPFGIPSEKPIHSRQVLKGVYKGITEQDKVLIWGGSILNWLDTLTLIKAMDRISQMRKDVKLFFMGTEHPDQIREKMLADTLSLSKKLGLTDRTVFFHTWVPYTERQNYFLEADIGLSTHFSHLETRFSFRTRILDYLWTGLPIIATRGDYFSELIQTHRLGLTVEAENVEDLTAAILKLVEDQDLRQNCSENIKAVAPRFTWDVVTQPLVDFCQNPAKAADKWRWKAEQNLGIFSLEQSAGLPITPWKRATLTSRSHLDKLYEQIITNLRAQKAEKIALLERIADLEDRSRMPSGSPGKFKVGSYLVWATKGGNHVLGLFKNLRAERRRKKLKLSQYPSCEIQGADTVGESFIAVKDNLYRIDIKFATYLRQVRHDLLFHLKEDRNAKQDLACLKIPTSQLRDNAFYSFIFPQQILSERRSYYFYLESPDSVKGDAVSVWCTEEAPPDQFHCQPIQRYERGWKVGDHIVFRVYYV